MFCSVLFSFLFCSELGPGARKAFILRQWMCKWTASTQVDTMDSWAWLLMGSVSVVGSTVTGALPMCGTTVVRSCIVMAAWMLFAQAVVPHMHGGARLTFHCNQLARPIHRRRCSFSSRFRTKCTVASKTVWVQVPLRHISTHSQLMRMHAPFPCPCALMTKVLLCHHARAPTQGDFSGHDILPSNPPAVADGQACCQKCASHGGCVAFSYVAQFLMHCHSTAACKLARCP